MYSPGEMASICSDAGVAKASLSAMRAFLLGVFAGVFIALGGLGSVASSVSLGGAAERLVRAAVFPAGLMFVILAGAELFTGNCLMLFAVFEGRCRFKRVLRQWAIVYLGNFLGSLLFAVWTVSTGMPAASGGWLGHTFWMTAVTKTSIPWMQAFLRGAGCNFLVCIAVWLSFSTKSTAGKIMAIWPPIFLFVLCGMEHSIANMSCIVIGMLAPHYCALKDVHIPPTLFQFLWNNLLPVTLGNIAGGTLVAAGYFFAYSPKSKIGEHGARSNTQNGI